MGNMLRKELRASQWRMFQPQPNAENGQPDTVHYFELHGRIVDFQARSALGVTLHAVTDDGELLFLEEGQKVGFSGHMAGFAALQVECEGTFAVLSSARARWYERPDPTPFALALSEPKDAGIQDTIRAELRKYLGRLSADKALASDVDVAELLDDINNGELDFEDEPEFDFGLSSAHMEPDDDFEEEEPAPQPAPPPPSNEGPAKGAVSDDAGGTTENPG